MHGTAWRAGPLLFDGSGPVPVLGHRGHSAGAPENTLASLSMAADLGADWCEIDIARCSDGLVLLHDPLLDRTTNGRGPVRSHTVAELQRLDAGSWFGQQFAGEAVPTLAEALQVARERDLGLVIETKERYTYDTDALMAMVATELDGTAPDRVVVSSFDQTAVRHAKDAMPSVRAELITAGRYVDPVGAAEASGADMVSLELKRFHPADAEVLHEAGIAVRVSLPPFAELDALEDHGFTITEQLLGWLSSGLIDILASDDTARARALTAQCAAA